MRVSFEEKPSFTQNSSVFSEREKFSGWTTHYKWSAVLQSSTAYLRFDTVMQRCKYYCNSCPCPFHAVLHDLAFHAVLRLM